MGDNLDRFDSLKDLLMAEYESGQTIAVSRERSKVSQDAQDELAAWDEAFKERMLNQSLAHSTPGRGK